MDIDRKAYGRYGSIWCKDTVVHDAASGTFFTCFLFTEASVFTSLGFASAGATIGIPSPGSVAATNTNTTFAGASSVLASMAFSAGTMIFGMWTSFTLASGGLIAYKDGLPARASG